MTLAKVSRGCSVAVIILLACIPASVEAQSPAQKFAGMWSDPPDTITGVFCSGWCTDAGIDRLYALLDDPANDARPIQQVQAEANTYQINQYLHPRLTNNALKSYPLDPADDPSFLRCEPYGLTRQMVARHQLEIRQLGKDALQFRYGEWDARRTIYVDGRKRPPNEPLSLLGYSLGHWEGETLVVETFGIRANRTPWQSEHSDQLHVVERYTRSADGKTLTVTATMEDAWGLKEPVVLKHIWGWRPDQIIAAYDQCEIPTEFKRGTK
jgi:hypothetical protein